MRTKVQKTRCVKRQLTKCVGVCRTYDDVQYAGADYVNALSGVKSFECNVLLKGLAEGDYTTDFVLTTYTPDKPDKNESSKESK